MTVTMEQMAQWLRDTTSPDEACVRSATAALASAEAFPGFCDCLLTISTGGHESGLRLAAATYLKNTIRRGWPKKEEKRSDELLQFRTKLVEVLLRVDHIVLKILIEAFRIIALEDYAGKHCSWPELVPALRTAILNSDLSGISHFKILNVLMVIQTTTKPFQYFSDPTIAREPVPEQLELVSKELIAPLNEVFHHLVQQAIQSKDIGVSEHGDLLLILCKIFHLAVRSHMPKPLLAQLGKWFEGFFALLKVVILEQSMDREEHIFRLKAWKRALQIFCTSITRHRKHVDKFLPSMSSTALGIVTSGARHENLSPMQERIVSLAFDVISNVLETGPGWRLLAPHFLYLIENAIFPALTLKEKDIAEWEEDEEEYMQKNLPSNLDDASGWREDLFTPRRSALNLLGLIATAKGPPPGGKRVAAMKRKKGAKSGSQDDVQGTAGEVLVIPSLARLAFPADGESTSSETLTNYYGVLLAYGALQEFLKGRSIEYLRLLLTSRVLPLYSMSRPSPYLLSNANWVLGEFAVFLPDELNHVVYESLIKALVAPEIGSISWRPVRVSAAGALCALFQEDYTPENWLPLLQAVVAGVTTSKVEEATISLQLLASAAEVAENDIAPHIPSIIEPVKKGISIHLPPPPEPWPHVVESGFAAMASLAQAWVNSEPDKSEGGGKELRNWKVTCKTVAESFSELLQLCWISPAQNREPSKGLPPPSCLSYTSVVLTVVLKYITTRKDASRMKIEQLLQVWADLIADWSAWEEEEDIIVFEAITEALNLHRRCSLDHFAVAEIPSPPLPPVPPRSILEALSLFLVSAIESSYSASVWRACKIAHDLLHATVFSSKGGSSAEYLVTRFVEGICMRLQKLSCISVPLGKPLILVLATCYTASPRLVEKIMQSGNQTQITGDITGMFLTWGEALASLAEASADPGLSLESELKLAVLALLKLLNCLLESPHIASSSYQKLAYHCFQSILDACVQLKEVQEEDDTLQDADGEDTEECESDDSDDGNDEDEEVEDHDETEEEFLERYAQTARELEEEAGDGIEGGQEEDGHELELGEFAFVDHEAAVLSCIKKYGDFLCSSKSAPQNLVSNFIHKFPKSKFLFPVNYREMPHNNGIGLSL